MVNGTLIQIYDSGMEEKGGSIVYTRADTEWIDLYATSIRPEINYIATNYESKKLNGDIIEFVGNRIESKNPIRFTISCKFPTNQIFELHKIIKMGNTLGLKRIQGGLGSLSTLQETYNADVYVIITSIQISETLNSAVDNISVTISLQMV